MGMSLVVGRMRGARVDFSLQLVLCIQFIPTLDIALCDRLLAVSATQIIGNPALTRWQMPV